MSNVYEARTVVCGGDGCQFWERVGEQAVADSSIKSEAMLLDRSKNGGGWTREVTPTLTGGTRVTWRCPSCTAKHEREKARLAEAVANAAATAK